MKPEPPSTPSKKFEDALRKVLSVPKSEVEKRAKEEKKSREQRDKRPD